MVPDPIIVAEMRRLFLSGATPSRLIRHIASRHSGDVNWPRYVHEYFWAAFSIVLQRVENKPHDFDFDAADLSHFNSDELHEIVVRASTWRQASSSEVDTAAAWFDGLQVIDEYVMANSAHPELHPALADSWPTMDEQSRRFVRQLMINAQGYYERMQLLVKLAERLQSQIIELEQRVASE